MTDGELREQIKQLAVYKAATNFHEQYRPDKSNLARFQANWIDGVLRLIKQNSPQGGVVLASQNNSFDSNHDSSIPDDDSLQSQPQQPESDEYQQIQRIYLDWHNGKRPMSGFIRDIQHLQYQRDQAARLKYAVDLKAFIDKQFAGSTDMNMVKSYVDASIKTLKRVAPERQDSEGGL
jgi:hypothetical protein